MCAEQQVPGCPTLLSSHAFDKTLRSGLTASQAHPLTVDAAGLTAALAELFKQGQRHVLLTRVPAAWALAQKLLASPAAEGSVLARCAAGRRCAISDEPSGLT